MILKCFAFWVKFPADDILKYYSYFSSGDNLHEMSNPVFLEK